MKEMVRCASAEGDYILFFDHILNKQGKMHPKWTEKNILFWLLNVKPELTQDILNLQDKIKA